TQVLEAILLARDAKLYSAITDCGAGGLSSAIGEMGSELGAEVDLEKVPLKYMGLDPWEVWLSEAQERMVLAVPPEHWPQLKAICDGLDLEATDLGRFTGEGRVVLRHRGQIVGDLETHFLHDGIPQRKLTAVWTPSRHVEPELTLDDASADLLALLARPEIRSKEEVVRRYDHEVQGATVVKPMVGVSADGPGNSTVLAPFQLRKEGAPVRGVALSVGINPFYGAIDPYHMAQAAVDEAMRNVVAVGADPEQVSLLDNFCWGNPNLPDRLGGLVRCARGCHDAAVALGAPYISGKDSLNNEYADADGVRHPIPGTILISAMGIVPDARATVTSDLKAAGHLLYLLGSTGDELGGGAWYRHHGHVGAQVPKARSIARKLFGALHKAIASGHVVSCHDLSEGGLAVALAEMAIGGRLGVEVDVEKVPCDEAEVGVEALLFSESLSRFVLEVKPEQAEALETTLAGMPLARIGVVTQETTLKLRQGEGVVLEVAVEPAKQAWRGHVGW
ncbi:MAG: AIR synthase-related protein, partial [Myxococcota bacterium]